VVTPDRHVDIEIVDAERQASVCSALLDNDNEPAEHGQRALGARRRRLHAGPHPRADQVGRHVAHVERSVRRRLLREAADRRRAVLVDAVCVGDRIHQNDGLHRLAFPPLQGRSDA